MISTTPIFRDGHYQINLVECKDIRGLAVRFHFEIINTKTGKCMKICDRLDEAKEKINAIIFKAAG